jgi:hypothetical protein
VRSGNVRREEVTLEDTLRGLEEGMSLVERARGLLEEIGRIQGNVLGGEESTGRLDCESPSSIACTRGLGIWLMVSTTNRMYVLIINHIPASPSSHDTNHLYRSLRYQSELDMESWKC